MLVPNSIDVSIVKEHKVDVCVLVRNNMKTKGKDVLIHDILGHNYFSMFDSKRGQSIKSHRF